MNRSEDWELVKKQAKILILRGRLSVSLGLYLVVILLFAVWARDLVVDTVSVELKRDIYGNILSDSPFPKPSCFCLTIALVCSRDSCLSRVSSGALI